MTATPGLLLVMIGIDPAHEDELNRWHDEGHFPERRSAHFNPIIRNIYGEIRHQVAAPSD